MLLNPVKSTKRANSSLNLHIWLKRMVGINHRHTCIDNHHTDAKRPLEAHYLNTSDWLELNSDCVDDTSQDSTSRMVYFHVLMNGGYIFEDSKRKAQHEGSRSAWALRYS